MGVITSRAQRLRSQGSLWEKCPLNPRHTLPLVEFLVPCPQPPRIICLSTELTTETVLSLEESGGWGEAGISRTPECPPPPHSRTLTNLIHQASEPLDKDPHLRLTHLLPLLQVCTCGCKGDSPWKMTSYCIPCCQRIQQRKSEEKQPERKEKHWENMVREARGGGRWWSKKRRDATTTKR